MACALVLSLGLVPAASAQALGPSVPEPADRDREPLHVVMLDAGTKQDATFLTAVSDYTRSVQLDLRVVPTGDRGPLATAITAGREPGTSGVFWLGHRDDGLAIYLYDPRDQGVYIRELARAEGESDAALVESVGLIVASTAAALPERGELGMRKADEQELAALRPDEPEPRGDPEPPDETSPPETLDPQPRDPRAPNPPPTYPQLRLGVAYLGDGFNRSAPWQSGVRGLLSLVVHRRVRVGIGYGFLAPARASEAPPLELTRHQISASVGIGGSVHPRITVHGVAVGTADLVRWQGPLGTGLRVLARAGPMFEVGITLVGGLALDLGIGAAIPINRFAFVVCEDPEQPCTGEDREVTAQAWPIAPRATAGLSYTLSRRARR